MFSGSVVAEVFLEKREKRKGLGSRATPEKLEDPLAISAIGDHLLASGAQRNPMFSHS